MGPCVVLGLQGGLPLRQGLGIPPDLCGPFMIGHTSRGPAHCSFGLEWPIASSPPSEALFEVSAQMPPLTEWSRAVPSGLLAMRAWNFIVWYRVIYDTVHPSNILPFP